MKNTKLPMIALGLLAVSALGGTAYQVSAQSGTKQNSTTVAQKSEATHTEISDDSGKGVETVDTVSPAVLSQIKVTKSQARQIALASNPATTITSIVVGDENGTAMYEITLSNKTEVKVDAVTGAIVKSDNTDEKDGDQTDQKDSHGNDLETNDGPDQNE